MSSLFCVVSSSSSSSSSVPSSFSLSTRLPSLVSSSDPTRSHAHSTPSSMLGMSRCNMVFNLKLGRPTSDYNNIHWVAELQLLRHHQCLRPQSRRRWTFSRYKRVAPSSLKISKEYIFHHRKWLRKLYVYSTNINMSNEDNNHDTNYINKYNDANHDTRKLHL